MRMSGLRTKTISKAAKTAMIATALAGGVFAATVDMAPAQAFPGKTEACTGCHTAGGTVVATPSSATLAPGAAFTVDLAITGGTGNVGYWISGNGASATGSGTSAAMTAPATAGTYEYTVWTRQTVASTSKFSITVGGGTEPTVDPTVDPTVEPTVEPTTGPTATPTATTKPVKGRHHGWRHNHKKHRAVFVIQDRDCHNDRSNSND
jgi:hypothetical protein